MKEAIKKVLSISDKSYYNYKEQRRPVILLLEKYFTKEDLNEFLETGKITKLENLPNFNKEVNRIVNKIEKRLIPNINVDDIMFIAKEFTFDLNRNIGYIADFRSFTNWLRVHENLHRMRKKNIEPFDLLFILSVLNDNEFEFFIINFSLFEEYEKNYAEASNAGMDVLKDMIDKFDKKTKL